MGKKKKENDEPAKKRKDKGDAKKKEEAPARKERTVREFWLEVGDPFLGWFVETRGKKLRITTHTRREDAAIAPAGPPEEMELADDAAALAKRTQLILEKLEEGYREQYEGRYADSPELGPVASGPEPPDVKAGKLLAAVIAKVERGHRRNETPDVYKDALNGKLADEARLLVWALSKNAATVTVGDFVVRHDDYEMRVPGATGMLIIGSSDRGDVFGVPLAEGKRSPVLRFVSKEKWKSVKVAESLEDFLRDQLEFGTANGIASDIRP